MALLRSLGTGCHGRVYMSKQELVGQLIFSVQCRFFRPLHFGCHVLSLKAATHLVLFASRPPPGSVSKYGDPDNGGLPVDFL